MAQLWPKWLLFIYFFFLDVQMDKIDLSCDILITLNWTKIAGMTTIEKLLNQCCHFEGAAVFIRQPIESVENRNYPCISIGVCDNPSKCIFNTLEFVQVKAGQTSEE